MMKILDKFRKNQNGNVAIIFALTAVSLTAVAGGAIDYSKSVSLKASLQTVADAAALATARELQLSGAKKGGIDEVAKQYIEANRDKNLKSLDSEVIVSEKKATVDIKLTAKVQTNFMSLLGFGKEQEISANAQALILGGLPLCVLALEGNQKQAINASDSAKLTATGCALYSNSTNSDGITSWGQAELITGQTCSAGGIKGGGGNYKPAPLSDCPTVPDPLFSRVAPLSTSCKKTGLNYSSGYHLIFPGTYCKGLTVTNTAKVLFLPGDYIIQDGPFEISGKAIAGGVDVAFYLKGLDSRISFQDRAHIGFKGRKTGGMAGFLFYEDRNTTFTHTHEITSPNVLKLEGTVYLPKNELRVAVSDAGSVIAQGIGSESAYTVIISEKLSLSGISNLVLNTDYASSSVPLPQSISNLSGRIALNR